MTGRQKYALGQTIGFLIAGCFLCWATPFTLGGSALLLIAVLVMITAVETDAKRKP